MEEVKCALCSADSYEIILKARDLRYHLTDDDVSVVKCKNCGLIYLNPRPSKGEMGRFYPEAETYYGINASSLVKTISKFFSLSQVRGVMKYKRHGRLLDIGCGAGDFLLNIERRGFEVYGVDISSQACKIAQDRLRRRGKTGEGIFNRELKECNFPDNYFDVITLWHVLEHLPNPNITLKEIHRILKKDGILILETPNIDSLSFKVFRKNYVHLEVPRHLYHWSHKTIKGILNRNKFKVLKINYPSLEFSLSLFHSFSNLLSGYKIKFPLYQLIFIIASPLLLILRIFFHVLPFKIKSEVLKVYAWKILPQGP
jgi:2-polyprenyl-3-methyl-5-hydroxy-6-metoxy-1,4-benzoquinol methylase